MKKEIKIALPDFEYQPNYVNALVAAGDELGVNVTPVRIGKDIRDTGEFFLSPDEFNVLDYDALLIPGGIDVDPCFYDEPVDGSVDMNREMDMFQMNMLIEFANSFKPVLGICRGHQLANVVFGGSLIQDIPEKEDHIRHNHVDSINMITAEKGSLLAELYGTEPFGVNSAHHQAVKVPGKNLVVTARSSDGVVEALEHTSLPIKTVQFHPERISYDLSRDDAVDGSGVLKWLITEAAKED